MIRPVRPPSAFIGLVAADVVQLEITLLEANLKPSGRLPSEPFGQDHVQVECTPSLLPEHGGNCVGLVSTVKIGESLEVAGRWKVHVKLSPEADASLLPRPRQLRLLADMALQPIREVPLDLARPLAVRHIVWGPGKKPPSPRRPSAFARLFRRKARPSAFG